MPSFPFTCHGSPHDRAWDIKPIVPSPLLSSFPLSSRKMVLTSIRSLSSLGGIHHSISSPSSSTSLSSADSGDSHSSESTFAGKTLDRLTGHIYMDSSCLRAEILREIFEKHSEGGLLTLCIDEAYDRPVGIAYPGFSYVETVVGVAPAAWNSKKVNDVQYHFASCESNVVVTEIKNNHCLSTTATQAAHLLTFSLASLRSVISITSACNQYTIHILERPTVVFSPVSYTQSFSPSQKTAGGNIPTVDEWVNVWRAWDLVTLQMIPEEMLHQKPIDLRHKCLFYIGHIPTFLDMLLSKAIGGAPTEPAYFWKIFERGIDPHVDDPDHCHNHSEVPDADEDWPTLDIIMSFRAGVRARLLQLYEDLGSGKRPLSRNIARTLVMTMEHEGFHIETLLYMLIQRAGTGTLPPTGFAVPPWDLLKLQWNATPASTTESVILGPAKLAMGHDDSEADDFSPDLEHAEGRTYGWDNESPRRLVKVGQFRASWRPVTNNEFMVFWRAGKAELPKSWVEEDGEAKVRTVYGPVSMDVAGEWPVLTAYDDLAAYAKSKGGRLPTEPELRLFLNTYDVGYEGGGNVGFRNWHRAFYPQIHLTQTYCNSNNNQLFRELKFCFQGRQRLTYFCSATTGLESEGGKGSNGGIWEWTTTLFDNHDDLVPTNLFTGYSTDFFDTKHQTLGASYATIPRLGRQTLRNFWQRGYGYAWVGGRIIWDI
ncbi:C-type lectin protein [Mycena sanguinolenta]|nr:C-type lectin protein [Mycena sanguinolenta]